MVSSSSSEGVNVIFYKYFCANSLRSADELSDQSSRNLFDINVNTPVRGIEGGVYNIIYNIYYTYSLCIDYITFLRISQILRY